MLPLALDHVRHVGVFASSKSAMKVLAPEFSALMTSLRSVGPVISTRRSAGPSGGGGTRQSPSRISRVSGRKSSVPPARRAASRSRRAASSSCRRGSKRRCRSATKRSASIETMSAYCWSCGGVASIPSGVVKLTEDPRRARRGASGRAAPSGGRPGSRAPSRWAAICIVQPGLAAAMTCGAGRQQVVGLAAAELLGRLGLHHVVDPGRAAAQLPLGGLDELEPRDRRAAASRGGWRTPWAWARWQASW